MSEARAARIVGLSLAGLWLAMSALAAIAASGGEADAGKAVANLERTGMTTSVVTVRD